MDNGKNLLIFHHSDLDGMGVKVLGLVIGDALELPECNIETFKCNYEDIDKIVEKRLDEGIDNIGRVIIGDISIQGVDLANRLDHYYQDGKFDLVLRDHHATATWMNEDYEWAEVKEKDNAGTPRCGTYWVYKTFYRLLEERGFINDTLVEFVRLVDLYDTFMFQADKENIIWDADKLNSIFKMTGEEMFTEKMMIHLRDDKGVFDSIDDMLYDIHTKKLDSKAKSLQKDMFTGKYVFYASANDSREWWDMLMEFYKEHRDEPDKIGAEKVWYKDFWGKIHNSSIEVQFNVGIVFYNDNISDIGRRILADRPDLDFLIFVSLPGFMSFRAAKELPIPLGIIAKYTTGNGGGHPCSAGARINKDMLFEAVNNLLIPVNNIKKSEENL